MDIYKSILAATDFSPAADQAVQRASDLAALTGAKLVLLHVLEHFPEDIPNYSIAPENADPKHYYLDEAKTRLEDTVQRLALKAVTTDTLASTHSAGREISDYASKNGLDLIVLGQQGARGILGMAGSTVNSVLHSATVDVLTVTI
ncbi:universal stress protein [Thiolapillus sp.]